MKKILLPLTLLVLLFGPNANAGFLMFWDTNGIDPGSGSSSPTGTWGVDAYWNSNPSGGMNGETNVTQGWGNGDRAVFSAGSDATGAYTIYVSNVVKVMDLHVDRGVVTFAPHPTAGGSLQFIGWVKTHPDDIFPSMVDTTNRLIAVGHFDNNAMARFDVPIIGATNIIRYKRGTVIFGATNTYAGTTTVEGGILQLGAPQVIPTNSNFILSNNNDREDVFPRGSFTPAALVLDGHSQTLGTLQLTGPNAATERTIDYGSGSAALIFADSSGESWLSNEGEAIPLHIVNYTPGSNLLRFGTSSSGLTASQLAQFRFAGFGDVPGKIDAQGYVTPDVPTITILSVARPSATQTDLTWTSVPGRNYRIQYKNDLSDASWSDIVPDVQAIDTTTPYSDGDAGVATRYYRIVLVP